MKIGILDQTESIGLIIMAISGLLFLFGSSAGYMLGAMILGDFTIINNPEPSLLPNFITMPTIFGFFIGFYLIFRNGEEKKVIN